MRRTLITTLAAVSCLGLVGRPGAVRAQAAAPPARCIIVLARTAPGTTTVNAVQRCGDASSLAAATADRYQVMTWYTDADYGGYGQSIYGDQGPCDRQGYRFDLNTLTGFWSRNLTSYRVYTPCWWSSMTSKQGEQSLRQGDVPYVGDRFNDNVDSIRVWSR